MAQQIQFIYLAQSEYDNLGVKIPGRVYFTSDTHRIYKGSDMYATTVFDQLSANSATFGDLVVANSATFSATHVSADTLTVGGTSVALVGHGHSAADISDLDAALSNYASVGHTHDQYALSSHTHSASDIVDMAPIVFTTQSAYDALSPVNSSAIYFVEDTNRIYKGSSLYATTRFDELSFSSIETSGVTVNGIDVALVGHTHSAADVSGLETAMSGYASVGHTHAELQGVTQTGISKSTGDFTTVTADVGNFRLLSVSSSAMFSVTSISADAISVRDLNLTGLLSIVTAAITSMAVVDLNATGSMTLNSKPLATQEYVDAQISAAIGQVLASAY